ncbi:MAG: bifunctional diaminohydroxyphosphoribosylaminopyrimidine deaminase/5-amino-6-(5-phosphoribosylamino)uracil reductase RibD [Flavobacteriales bacterium]|nr:bifunctional diaminohydroxyphosphoribosylaminopyrimidine deaminase/5-amino-6-(5-phosphoribosylamino)uracil reductase RibD [Flavobacteriales bacterium]
MRRCLQLANLGSGTTGPNPLVGAVLVQGEHLLAEGWHERAGGPHAEARCLQAFGDGPIPADATMYVNLEPCAHHGRTPPCADLLIARGVKQVVVGLRDPFPLVAGRGIERLRNAGVEVTEGVMLEECHWMQRRFITSVEKKRPYVILKWAASADGFLDRHPRTSRGVQRISGAATDVLVHRWRSAEPAILVGSRTVVHDDPSLSVRHVSGRSPLRLVLDRDGITPGMSNVFTDGGSTMLFTSDPRPELSVEQVRINPTEEPLDVILATLHERNIRSVLVEGGAELIRHFMEHGLWDEARVIHGQVHFGDGTPAPRIDGAGRIERMVGGDRIVLHRREAGCIAWDW